MDFARHLYNVIHMELEDENGMDTRDEIHQLNKAIYTTSIDTDQSMGTGGSNNRACTDDDDGADGRRDPAAEYAELRAHGYEVESAVIVDYPGDLWEPICGVWQPLPTHHTPR